MTIQKQDVGLVPGQPGPSVRELLDSEHIPVPALLLSQAQEPLGLEDISIKRYISQEFHDLEMENVWKRVWQMACHEDDIPNVGDTLVYEIGDLSVLLVRAEADEIYAFPNACLHRGAQLRTADGNVPELRCPFHGLCWDLKGNLTDLPAGWDFPQVDQKTFGLPRLQVDRWEGFVFINFDVDAPPLAEFLGDVVTHVDAIARPPLRERVKAVHVAKPIRCNWKVALEAFIESFHVTTTHPQAVLWGGDVNTQYDVYARQPHWNRMITLTGVPSPLIGDGIPEQEIADELFSSLIGGDQPIELPDGTTAREFLGNMFRGMAGQMTGNDFSDVTDAQLLDTIEYFVFPNFVTFIGVLISLTYRFRPLGSDPNMCIMEIMLMQPCMAGQPRPPATPIRWLGEKDVWSDAPELGNFGAFLNQDLSNIASVQRGLHSSMRKGLVLSQYQESRIRHFHRTLGEYVDR